MTFGDFLIEDGSLPEHTGRHHHPSAPRV